MPAFGVIDAGSHLKEPEKTRRLDLQYEAPSPLLITATITFAG